MRTTLGVCRVLFGAGCTHSPGKSPQAASPQELSSQADKAYDAQDFSACAELFRQAADHPLVDVAVVVDALSMPQTSNRNKALYLLKMLLDDLKPDALKAQQGPLLRQLGPQLVTLTSMQQPINREPAIEVLQQLSGEKYETTEQWKAWLARQPQ